MDKYDSIINKLEKYKKEDFFVFKKKPNTPKFKRKTITTSRINRRLL